MRRRHGGRWWGARARPPAGPLLLVAALAVLPSACTGGPPAPVDPGTTPAASTAVPGGTDPPPTSADGTAPGGTATGPAVDCARVEEAKEALDGAIEAEMDRLGVGAGDPRAPSVSAIATTLHGKDYQAALVEATSGATRADAERVLGYYEHLAVAVGDIDLRSGSATDLGLALQRIDAASAAQDPAVLEAQQRVQARVEAACTGEPTATASTPAGGTGST
ncbi:hypothetical protein NUM3379_40820 [Kineococcus sp. NUM-3379]